MDNINKTELQKQLSFYIKDISTLETFLNAVLLCSENTNKYLLLYSFYNEEISYSEFVSGFIGQFKLLNKRKRSVWKEIYNIKVYTKQKDGSNYILYKDIGNINNEINKVKTAIYGEDSIMCGDTALTFDASCISIDDKLPFCINNNDQVSYFALLLNGDDEDSIKFQTFYKELLKILIHY